MGHKYLFTPLFLEAKIPRVQMHSTSRGHLKHTFTQPALYLEEMAVRISTLHIYTAYFMCFLQSFCGEDLSYCHIL